MRAELKVIEGKHQGAVIPINRKKFLVGRESDCQLRPNSDLVSRHHCVFAVDDYGVRLRDLGSTNGTYVNGERISGHIALKDGDQVRIGKLVFQVSIRANVVTAAPATAVSPAKPTNGTPVGLLPPVTGDSGSANTVDFSLSESGMLKIDESSNKTGVFGGDTTLLSPNGAQRTTIDIANPLLNRPTPLPTNVSAASPSQETQMISTFTPPPSGGLTPPPAVPPVVAPPPTAAVPANGTAGMTPPPPTVSPEGAAPKASPADIIRQYMQKRGQ